MINTPAGPIPTLADLSMMAGKQTYRARRINNKTRGERAELVFAAWLEEIGAACPACGKPMLSHHEPQHRVRAPDQITVDHIRARALGGTQAVTNQWCICQACNRAKSLIEGRLYSRRKARRC